MSEAHAPPKHPYHLVAPSPWPLVGAIAAGLITTGAVLYMHGYGWTLLIIGALAVLAVMAVWSASPITNQFLQQVQVRAAFLRKALAVAAVMVVTQPQWVQWVARVVAPAIQTR